ncbi:MAG: RNA polymerase factor sigma-54 [Gammaproteobacteria bacterium]
MSPGQRLSTGVSQRLALAPRQSEALRLLAMPAFELTQVLEAALEQNAMLDRVDAESDEGTEALESLADSAEEPDAWDDLDWASNAGGSAPDGHDEYAEAVPDLRQHLSDQLELERFSARDYAIALTLVDALDADGYLRETVDTIAAELDALEPPPSAVEVEATLQRVQRLDPVGVGARTPVECLLLQLDALPADTAGLATARCLLELHFDQLARAELSALARLAGVDSDTADAAMALIHGLNPRPGADYAATATEYLVPELRVRRGSEGWQVEFCPGTRPQVLINQTYADWLGSHRQSEGAELLTQQLEEARWLLRSLAQREETLLRVARMLVRHQSAFLDHGPLRLAPLTLREVAAELELHESTVSRAVQGKSLATPRGVFLLRHLFSTALSNANEEALSAHAVRERLRHLLTQEDPAAPLSDAALAAALARENMPIARRTVTKYREALGFASTRERKRPAHSTAPSKGERHAKHDHRSSSGNHSGPEGLRQYQAGSS